MSYGLDISFKNCKSKDIYKNIQEFSNLIWENRYEIIKDNIPFLPLWILVETYSKTKDKEYVKKEIDNWLNKLFTYHIYYSSEIKSLCFVYNSYKKKTTVDKWFDGYVYFQNSCDQDYDYKEWEFNDRFKQYIDKVKNSSGTQFRKLYKKYVGYEFDYYKEGKENKEIEEYDRKTLVYGICYNCVQPIWDNPINLQVKKDAEFGNIGEINYIIRILCGIEKTDYIWLDTEIFEQYKKIFGIGDKND